MSLIHQPAILGVTEGLTPDEVAIRFDKATAAEARSIGHSYGLELTGGPLIDGPMAPGRFVFRSPRIEVQAVTPTTAIVSFPMFLSSGTRAGFLKNNNLHLIEWQRQPPEDDSLTALVQLPPANLHPELIDPIQGQFRIALPSGLTLSAVLSWAADNLLNLITYTPETGSTIVRPHSWTPPIVLPTAAYPTSQVAQSLPPPASLLYVQFMAALSSAAVASIASGLGMDVVDLTSGGLATLSGSPDRVKAEIQLLSDMASVQCVSSLPNPCAAITGGGAAATAQNPALQQPGQPAALTAQARDGVLMLNWSAASGATAYAIFRSDSVNGPFTPLAVVAGQQRTEFHAFDLTSEGQTTYYQVVALHPCTQPGQSTACDSSAVIYPGSIGVSTAWTNPHQVAAPPLAPNDASAARSQAAPATPPSQIHAGAAPVSAPAAITANATDGHVALSWASVSGANAYRLYRSTGDGPALYIAETSELSFMDVGGSAGVSYAYHVAAVAPSGLVGRLSAQATATWVAATSSPTVVRSLPAEANPLSGRVRLQVDAQSGSGLGSVEWRIAGPASVVMIGTAQGQPSARAALSWSAALTWDTSSLPDATYTVSATVTDAAGPQVTSTTKYRILNGAPLGPDVFSATAQGNGVALTWEQPAAETGTAYRLYRDQRISDAALIELSAGARTYLDATVTAGQHVYQLLLVDAAGHQSAPATVTITVQPTATRAEVERAPELKLLLPNGQPLAEGGRATDRLLAVTPNIEDLQFQLSSDGSTWSRVGQNPRCGEVCSLDLDLREMTPGPYLIRARTPEGPGNAHSFVRSDAVRYAPPTDFNLTLGGLGVNLAWKAPALTLPAAYRIERRDRSREWHLLNLVAGNSYIDSSPPAGSAVSYRVVAVDSEGIAGQPSSEASIRLPEAKWAEQEVFEVPAAPGGLEVLTAQGRAVLRWQQVAGSEGYAVERRSDDGGPFARIGVVGSESFTEDQALGAGQYAYRIVALNGPVSGSPSAESSALVVPASSPPPMSNSDSAPAAGPPLPTDLKTTIQSGDVHLAWSAPSGTPPSTTYNVYRMNPVTGLFSRAATGLEMPSFTDAALPAGATYGYTVTASAPTGKESPFSTSAWSAVPQSNETLDVQLIAPASLGTYVVQGDNLLALAQVSSAAGLAGLSFAISAAGGSWRALPSAPIDPSAPKAPGPLVAAGAGALWASSFNTSSLAPGSYQIRVQVRDRAGRLREQVHDLFIAGPVARGPPSVGLTSTRSSGGMHLEWSSSVGPFTIQRSLFGPDGPFESIATTQSSWYDDRSAVPGQAYAYRVLSQGAASSRGSVAADVASASGGPADGPVLQLGVVSQSELTQSITPASATHVISADLRAVGTAFDVNVTSLASGVQVHRLGEQARITFQLPPGTSAADAASTAILHWDDVTSSWTREDTALDATSMSVSAVVDHLSQFIAASAAPSAGAGSAQQPAPPTEFRGAPFDSNGLGPDGEVLAMRTATSQTYKNADGSLHTVVTAGLVNYKDGNGNWQRIDSTLVADNATPGYMRNAAGPAAVGLPDDLGASPVMVQTAGGSATFILEGRSHTSRVVNGSNATYQDVMTGVTASYTVLPEGLKESLVLANRTRHPAAFTFDLTTRDLVLSRMADGSVQATDASGHLQFTIAAPWMHDASTPATPEGAISTNIAVTLTGGSGAYRLTYRPDASWLQDPARRYPVTIDPSLTYYYGYGGEYDDQINAYASNYNYHAFSYLPIGDTPFDGCCYAPSRALVYFGVPLGGTLAYAASVQLYQYTNYYGGGQTIWAQPAAGPWSFTGVNWNNAPGGTCLFGCPTQPTLNGAGWLVWDVSSIVKAWQTGTYPYNGFLFNGVEHSPTCSPMCDEEFFASDNYSDGGARPRLNLYWYDESGTITRQGPPQPVTAVAGSLFSVPVTVTNTANQVGGSLTWRAFNYSDMVRVGMRDYYGANGVQPISNLPNLRNYLPADIGPGGSQSMNAVFQAPGDPGDYLMRIDLVHETPTSATWFSDLGNKPLVVRVRVLAPGDDATTHVPVLLGDGTTLTISTSNGFATLAATDFNIPERGSSSLRVGRMYNGVNGAISSVGTGATNSTFGMGWTFDFQRSLHLGSLSSNAYSLSSGIVTDGLGRPQAVTWDQARGMYVAGGTLTPSTAQVTSASSTLSVPAVRAVDLLNGSTVNDTSAPGSWALSLEAMSGPPSVLIMPAGMAPIQQNGTIEFWFKPSFNTFTDGACHVFFADTLLRFGLAWNCPLSGYSWGTSTSKAVEFFTYDGSTYNALATATINTWGTPSDTANGGWHHITLTWLDGGAKTLQADGFAGLNPPTVHGQASPGDLIWGYQPNAYSNALNYLYGRIAQLRIDGRVVAGSELSSDATYPATLSATPNTVYLGVFNAGSAASASGTWTLRNSDQSTETYSSTGVLLSEADRNGNQIDYLYDTTNKRITISDHFLPSRTIVVDYSNPSSVVATDFTGRTVTYQISGGDLVSVTKNNQYLDPRTGFTVPQNPMTQYAYTGHVLSQVTDPMGARTTVNYDQSYRQVVLIDNPGAYFRLGETTGTSARDQVNGFLGTNGTGVTIGQGGALWNDPGLAYKFDGTVNAGVQAGYQPAYNPAGSFTVEAWAKMTSAGARTIVSTGSPAAFSGFALGTSGSAWQIQVGNGSAWTTLTNGLVTLNQWTHVAATFNAGVLTLYVNGNGTSISSVGYVANASQALTIGSGLSGANFLGSIDEVAIYAAALTASRLQTHFISGRLGVGSSISGYAANVAYDSPVAFWRLDEPTAPRAYDQSGTGTVATYVGGVVLARTGAFVDDSDSAVSFDGSSAYVSQPDNPALFTSGLLTAEAWFKASAFGSGASIVNRRTAGNIGGFTLEANASGQIQFFVYVGSTWYSTITPTGLSAGVWHHVAGTYDGANIKVYVDGQLNAQTAVSGAANNPSSALFLIGKNAAGGPYFNGLIDEPAVYATALSATRIAAHYSAGRPASLFATTTYRQNVLADQPSGYWRLDETSGTTAADISAGNRPGVYNGVTLGQPGALATDGDLAAGFNGSSSYVTMPTQSIANAITVEAWVNSASYTQSGFIVAKNPVNANWELFLFNGLVYWRSGGNGCVTGTNPYTDLTTPAPSPSMWHHIVAVQNGTSAQIFIDGALAASSGSMAPINNGSGTIEIGRYATAGTCTGSYYFNGPIDEVAIYPAALAAARIRAHYQSAQLVQAVATGWNETSYATTVADDRAVGFWRFDEPAGSASATDRSGSANTGTYSGATLGVTTPLTPLVPTEPLTAGGFDGSTSYVVIPTSSSLNVASYSGAPLTLEAWIYKSGSSTGPIMEFNNGSAVGVHFWNWPNSDQIYINFVDTAGATHNLYSPSGVIAPNNWYHVAAVYDGYYGSLFVNGAIVARAALGSFQAQTSYPLYVARRPSGSPNYYLSATIGDVALYPYAVSATRMSAHYSGAYDVSQRRVATVQDGRGNTVATLRYNDDLATTHVIDGRGLSSFYTFQQFGGRTMSITDTGGNVTRYEYDGGAAYRLVAVVSPTGVRHTRVMNAGGPVGQQDQVLMEDDANQPSTIHPALMSGAYPDPGLYGATTLYSNAENWVWDYSVSLQPGIPSHRSTPTAGFHQHHLTFAQSVLIPAGSRLLQWVYIEAGAAPPNELMIQLAANDSTGWGHRVYWGQFNLYPSLGTSCPSNCQVSQQLPAAGKWVLLTIQLGPRGSATTQVDVDLAGRMLNGIAFSVFDGNFVWWGPTVLEFPAPSVPDPNRAVREHAYNSSNDLLASVDPNGNASVTDYDGFGLARQSATGIASTFPLITEDKLSYSGGGSPWTLEFAGTNGTSSTIQYNGMGSLTLNHGGAGLQSDLYLDRTGLIPGTYIRVTVWTEAVGYGSGGAILGVESAYQGVTRFSAPVQSPTWAQLSVPFIVDSSGKVRIHLQQQNFSGTTYWADVRIEDITPVPDITLQPTGRQSAWMLATAPGVTATWSNLGWGGVGNGPARKISVTSGTAQAADVADTLAIATLRNRATYVISAWASASVPGTTIDFSLRDANGNLLLLDNPITTCAIGTTPTLCQNSLTYNGADFASNKLTLRYGGFGVRDVYLSHPLVALSSELRDYTQFGQETRVFDIFGHETRTDYDTQSLYVVQTTTKVTPDGAPATLQPNSYPSQVLVDAPLAYWRLGETSGNSAADTSGHNYTGTLNGSITLGMQGPLPADPNGSMAFNGSSANVTANVTGVDQAGAHQVTVDFWMYWLGANGQWQLPFAFGTGSQGTCLCFSPTGLFGFNTTANDIWGIDGRSLANRWVHVTAVFFNGQSPQSLRLYINGAQQALSQQIGVTGTTQVYPAVSVGTAFKGQLDEVAVYNGALGSTRVQAHYLSARPQAPSQAGKQADYASSVLFDQPKGYWRFGETAGGTAGDSSGFGQHAAFGGGYSLGVAGAFAGDPNAAVSFNGSSGYAITGNLLGLFPTTAVTIELWFNARHQGVLVTELGQYGLNQGWHDSQFEVVDVAGRGEVRVRVWYLSAVVLGQVAYNTWHHAVLRYDGNTLDGFLDGVKSSASVTAARSKPTPGLYYAFGATDSTNMGSGAYFDGLIDDAAVYSSAVTDARVLAHYQAGLAAYTAQPSYAGAVMSAQPVGYWRLEETSGVVAADSSSNGASGAIASLPGFGLPGAVLTERGRAMRLDGSSTVSLNLTKIDTTAGHQVSVELWMNWAGGGGGMPFGFSSYDLYLVPGSGFGFNTGNSDLYGVSMAAIPQNTWLHVVAVFTNNAYYPNQIYINGVRQALVQILGGPAIRSVSAQANISGWPAGGYQFNGRLDEVAVYNGALSASTVMAHYQAGRAVPASVSPYAATVLSDNPRGYWRLGDPPGAGAADASGYGNIGTLNGTITQNVAGNLPYDADSAASFDGASGYISAAPIGSLPRWTLEAWINPSGGQTNDAAVFSDAYTTLVNYALYFNASGSAPLALQAGFYDGAGWHNTAAVNVTQGVWSHVAATYDGATIVLYVNGAQVSSQAYAASPASNGNGFRIGRRWDSGNYFAGTMDEAAVYATALSPARILAHYQARTPAAVVTTAPAAPAPPAITGLISQFQFNPVGYQPSKTRVSGVSQITVKQELDFWGRVTAEVENYVSGGPSDAQTNVRTGHVFDLNGQPTDTYTQGTQPTTWVDSHVDFDAHGNVVDEIKNVTAGGETASQNVTARFVYDAANQRTDEISPAASAGGSTTAHKVLDATGRVFQSIDNYVPGATPDSQTNVTTTTFYDADGRPMVVWRPMGSGQVPIVYFYDGLGRLIRQVAGTATPPAGFQAATGQVDRTLDAGGRVTDELGPGTGSPAVRYDTHADYDALGRELSVTRAFNCGTGCTSVTTTYVYDPRGATIVYSPPTQQLPAGVATRTESDLAGEVLRHIQDWQPGAGSGPDLNVTTQVVYDGFGRPTDEIDPRLVVKHTNYDNLDRPTSITIDPTGLNLTTSFTYSLAGDRIQVITPRDVGGPRVDQTVYDALHRPITVYQNCVSCLTTGQPDTQTNIESDTTYDSQGLVLTQSERVVAYSGATPFTRVTQTDYDHLGRKVDQVENVVPPCTAPASDQCVTTRWTYDTSGLTTAELSPRTGGTDGINLTTAFAYDDRGRLASVTEDKGSISNGHLNLVTTYTYDPSGNLVSMTDPRTDPGNHTTNYTIDRFGHTTDVTDPSGYTIHTNYSLAGEGVSVVNARGTTNSFTLDRLGRIVSEAYLRASGSSATLNFEYDAASNRTSFTDNADPAKKVVVTFDNAGRVTAVGAPGQGAAVCSPPPAGAAQTCYQYFKDGAVQSVSDITGTTVFTEDPLGRISSTIDPLEAGTTTYAFDSLSRLISTAQANGISISVPTTGGYSGLDQLLEKDAKVSGTTFASWVNSYDVAGNPLSEAVTLPNDTLAGTTTFQYDTLQQLSYVNGPGQGQITYLYDPAHNRSCMAAGPATNCAPNSGGVLYSYQANNGITSAATQTSGQTPIAYATDQDGNQTSALTNAGISVTLKFDSLNRLEQDIPTSGPTVTFAYDALGRLVTRSDGTTTVTFTYRGLSDQVVQEKDSLNNTWSFALDSRGHRLAVQLPTAAIYGVLTNSHGDVVGLAQAVGGVGVVQGWAHYDTWGKVLASGGTQLSYPFGFQGSYTDPLGFVLMGARWYYPALGRFLSSDPASVGADTRSPISRERWIYGDNSPLRFSDPTGLNPKGMCDIDENGHWVPCPKDDGDPLKTTTTTTTTTTTGNNTPTDTNVVVCDQACVDAYVAALKKKRDQEAAAAARKKNCDWWDLACKAKKAWDATTKAVGDAWNFCKNNDICKTAVTVGVGIAVYAGCTAITAGAGALACGVVAGAVSGAVSGAMDCKSSESMGGCLAKGAAVGAATGLIGGVAGKVVAAVGGKIAGAVINRLASKVENSVLHDAAEVCAVNSFAAGTLVLMADGSKKRIEDIQPGDLVVAGDPQKGVERAEPVQYVIIGHGLKRLYDIQVDGEVIEATYNHPFWVVELQAFAWAEDLVPGQHVLLADGRAPPIRAISHHEEITTVYNLSIANIHTFFVGPHGVLVHNACGVNGSPVQKVIAQVTKNREAGQKGESFLKETYGGRQQASKSTPFGRRFIDNLTEDGTAQESKVGRTALTKRVVSQINKDRALLEKSGSGVDSVQWHFFPSKTGVGPTPDLEEALLAQGFDIVIH